MRLLVSVRSVGEARVALANGADIIDAKEPSRGALGAVSPHVLRAMALAVHGVRPLSAALGETRRAPDDVGARAAQASRAGTAFVKIGLTGLDGRAVAALAAAVRGVGLGRVADGGTRWGDNEEAPWPDGSSDPRADRSACRGDAGHAARWPPGAGRCGVVAVAYADWRTARRPAPHDVLRIAAIEGATGLLVDTAGKLGPGLRGLMRDAELADLVGSAHASGLFIALAGQLCAGDLPMLRSLGADIAGVRGAACTGGRTGRLDPLRVRHLSAQARGQARSIIGGDDDVVDTDGQAPRKGRVERHLA